MNDREAAWQYAFSAGMASKNKLQIDYDSVEYEVISNISFEDIMNMNNAIISIRIEWFWIEPKIIIIDKKVFFSFHYPVEAFVWRRKYFFAFR